MTSGVTAIPARASWSAATSAAICSLSTSTPLQSKMITEASQCVLRRRAQGLKCCSTNHSLKKLGNAAMAKVGRCGARKSFLHSL
jgi:hypothetical protein